MNVQIKQLEWEKSNVAERWTAATPWGLEEIIRSYISAPEKQFGWFDHGAWHWLATLDEAKAAAQADFDQRIRSALAEPVFISRAFDPMTAHLFASPPSPAEVTPTHRHVKRGSEYVMIGFGKMQAERWTDGTGSEMRNSVDMREVAIYRSVDDGSLWVRPREEFEDGRFAALDQHGKEG